MLDPLVSVVITTNNRAELLPHALDSMLHQTYNNLQIIVFNDGSTDDTASVLETYQRQYSSINVLSSRISTGPGAARNQAIRYASGQYIAIMDDDDQCPPQRIEQQVAFLEQNNEIGLCFGLAQIITDDGPLLKLAPDPQYVELVQHHTDPRQLFESLLLYACWIPNPAVMGRKSVFITYPYSEVLIPEDWYQFLCMTAKGVRFGIIPEIHLYFNRHSNLPRMTKDPLRLTRGRRDIIREICEAYDVNHKLRNMALSMETVREARYWGRLRGLAMTLHALWLWPNNQLARRTFFELLRRGWAKVRYSEAERIYPPKATGG
jgi:glycosyltransferase involved in cell wall biosynthesis